MSSKEKYQPLIEPVVSWQKNAKDRQNFAECIMQPLEPGFGVTFGNVLRRILLGGIEGSAVTSVIIDGVNNEFSVVSGVIEDVMSILLNLKSLIVKNSTGENGVLRLKVNKMGAVLASQIECDAQLEIVNKDFVVLTLAEGGQIDMTLFVESGRGYVAAQWPQDKKLQEDNRIYIDAVFAPVVNVSLEIQKTRVGANIDYDKLILGITTNGTITPEAALDYAISVALHQFNSFMKNAAIAFASRESNREGFIVNKEKSDAKANEVAAAAHIKTVSDYELLEKILSQVDVDAEFFFKSIDALGLSARIHNSLLSAGISRVLDLVNSIDTDIISIKNLGKKSFEDLVQIMKDFGLTFNMKVSEAALLEYMEKNNVASK